jgi:hypothetical protein
MVLSIQRRIELRVWTPTLVLALLAVAGTAPAQGIAPRHFYVVPGVHYGTPSRTSLAVTAFLDGRHGIIGKGNLLILEAGPDAVKAQLGIANVSQSPIGYSTHVGYLHTRKRPIDAEPNAGYAGAEFHLYVSVLNLGTGFYAPVGTPNGRHGLLHLGVGLGF